MKSILPIIRVAFTWNSPSITPPSIVFKVPGLQSFAKFGGKEAEANFENDLEYVHTNENKMYRYLWGASEKYNAPLKIARIYYASRYSKNDKKGLMIMDDFSVAGTTIKMIPGFNNEQVESYFGVTVFDGFPNQNKLVLTLKKGASALKTISPNYIAPIMDEIYTLYTPTVYHFADYTSNKFGFPPTLVHSDLWSANLIFKKNSDGTISNDLLTIIDWQTGHAGNPFADIGRLLAVNTPVAYRRRETNRLLKRYYDAVSAEMNGKAPFTEEQMHYAYNAGMGFVAQFLGFGAPIYYNMPAIVGTDENKGKRQEELLDRTKCFFEDTFRAFKEHKIER